MAKNIGFLDFFVLMKGIYEIVQAKNKYLHKVDTMSLHLIIIRPFAQFWIVTMTSLHSCSEGYVQQRGQHIRNCHLTLLMGLPSINSHSNYSWQLIRPVFSERKLFSCVCTK